MSSHGRSPAALALLLALSLFTPVGLLAQGFDRQAACRAARIAVDPDTTNNQGCRELAFALADRVTDPLYTVRASADTAVKNTPRKLQSMRAGQAEISGVPGQAEAASAAQPTPLASASLAAAGTDSGTKSIAAISINPVTLFGGVDTAAAAKWSRFADLTVLVPVESATGTPGQLGYFGVRGRLNFIGLDAGDRLLADVDSAFKKALRQQLDLTEDLRNAFDSLPDAETISACAQAIVDAKYGDSPDACLGRVTIGLDQHDYDDLHQAVLLAREKADARYVGLDLRFDHGDPTLARDPTKEVDALQAGIAFGRRIVQPNPNAITLGLQGRLGVRYSDPKTPGDSVVWSLDGALGFETSRIMSNEQPVKLSTGIEFRYANKSDAVAERNQTDYLVVRGGLSVPLVGGTSVSVGFTGPLTGDVSPDLSVSFNWGLLMSSIADKAGGT